MGKPMFNFGKNAKEKARQLKQTEKTAKRLLAKKQRAETANISNEEAGIAEPSSGKGTAPGVV
jgi:hypothetical protein